MRTSLLAPLLLSTLLAACATKGDIPPSKHISQSGSLKVHPALLGQPAPAELQQEKSSAPVAGTTPEDSKLKMDSQPAQR